MTEILIWCAMFFGSGFVGGFVGVVAGVFALRVVKNHQHRKQPAWSYSDPHDWRGL